MFLKHILERSGQLTQSLCSLQSRRICRPGRQPYLWSPGCSSKSSPYRQCTGNSNRIQF